MLLPLVLLARILRGQCSPSFKKKTRTNAVVVWGFYSSSGLVHSLNRCGLPRVRNHNDKSSQQRQDKTNFIPGDVTKSIANSLKDCADACATAHRFLEGVYNLYLG